MPSVLPLVLLTSELDASPALQSASAGNPAASPGSPPSQVQTELNTGEGLKSGPDVPVASGPFQPEPAARQTGNCNNNGPLLNLAPGSYIQFKVAVPPGFLARMDDTPDGGKVITVLSPEPPCPKCGTGREIDGPQGSGASGFDAPAPTPQNFGNMRAMQNYQESAQMMLRPSQASPASPQPSFQQQHSSQDPISSQQIYTKNSAYRKVQVQQASPIQYQSRGYPNFPPQPSFQRSAPAPPPPQAMPQRMARPPIPSGQYQQVQFAQPNNAPDYQPQQQQQPPQYAQQGAETISYQQQTQFQPPPPSQQSGQPAAALENFHAAVRSLDDGSEQ